MLRLSKDFYIRDVLKVAPELIGKELVVSDKSFKSQYIITEVEAYRGEEDLACHASKGRTSRTEIMYHQGGYLYVFLIYGMYWMLNIVTGNENNPQAVLIRGLSNCDGPGRLGKLLGIDKSFYGECLLTSKRIWINDTELMPRQVIKTPRIGIDYAGEIWKNKPWRFIDSRFMK